MSTEYLTKKEAAHLAGVSERTLERYVTRGALPASRTAGAATISFARADIENLKRELEMKYPARVLPARAPTTDTISFRLATLQLDRLNAVAAAAGISPGAYARFVVVQDLEQAEKVRTERQISDLAASLTDLGKSLAESIAALLMLAGRVEDEDEANAFVKKLFASFVGASTS